MEEDEFTEKIDKSTEILTNIQKVQLNLDEAETENKVNESLTGAGAGASAGVPREETTQTESLEMEDFDLQVIETKFDQPDVEIINAAETNITEEPSHPTTSRHSDYEDPTPPPQPKIAFQEESSISRENNEKMKVDINSMLNLGRRVTGLHISLKYFKMGFRERSCLQGDRKHHQNQTRGSEHRQLCLHLHDQEWWEASEEMV